MRRAWNPEFYEIIQNDFPDYKDVSYNDAFYRWKNSFHAVWPSLLKDPDSDSKIEDVRQKAVMSMMEILLPQMDPVNRARVIEWAIETSSENKLLFPQPLVLDYEALRDYEPPQPQQATAEPKPEHF